MARTCFTELNRLLGDQACFGGDRVSFADILLAAQLDLLCDTHEGAELIGGTQARAAASAAASESKPCGDPAARGAGRGGL